MSRRIFLTVLALAFWLVNTLICFCCDFGHSDTFGPELTACPESPSGPTPEKTSEDCGFCCGHQVFIAFTSAGTYARPPRENFVIESLTFFNQFNLRSIYHPPKA